MTNLTVGRGAGYQFGTISAATAAAAAGDTVTVQAGTYTNDFATVYNSISLVAVGGVVSMVATVAPPNGKALLTDYASVSVNGFAFYGAAVADANGAGIRQGGGDLTVTNCLFQDNQDGILVDGNPDTTVTIRHSEFNHNGAGDGYSHNIYVGAVKAFIADDIYSHDAIVGHEIKSRAAMTSITNSRIQDNATGTASYGIDLPNGGVAIISNNVLQKGPASPNNALVDYGSEGNVPANSTLTISGNTVVNDVNRGFLLLNRSTVKAAVTNNSVYGFTLALENGPANETGTTVLGTRPTLNTAAVTLTGATPAPVPVPTPAPAGPDTLVLNLSEDAWLGDAQAIIAIDGVVQGGPRTITALRGLGQGQDVSITGSFGNSTHVVSVSFINDAFGGTALTDRNLYLNSIKLNGSTVAGASQTFLDNGSANFSFGAASPTPTPVPVPVPVLTPAPAGPDTLVLNLSEDAWLGDAQAVIAIDGVVQGGPRIITALKGLGQGQDVSITGSFGNSTHVVSVSFINDAFGGTALTDRNLYLNSIKLNGSTVAGASQTFLDNGSANFSFGAASPTPTPVPVPVPAPVPVPTPAPAGPDTLVLNLSEDAYLGDAQAIIAIDGVVQGGPRTITALRGLGQGQDVSITGSFGNSTHVVSVSFINDAFGGTALTDRNLYLNSIKLNGSTVAGASQTFLDNGSADFSFGAASPTPMPVPVPVPAPVPVPTPAPAGSDTLVLNLSEDAYLGDAQAVIAIDGVVQGGPRTITALRGLGQGQDVSITGSFGNSTHVVSVSFINDAFGGTALTDRNLYLNSIKLNGSTVAGASQTFLDNGSANFSFGAASPTPTPVPVPVPAPVPVPTPAPSPITYALEGPKWSPGPITWAFENNNLPSDTSYPFSNPIGTYQSTVLAAFTKWGSVASIPLQQVADTSSLLTAPDIRIGFSKLNTGGTGTIGLTSYRYSTGAVSVFANDTMVRLEDPSELAVTAAGGYSGTGATLYQVALHEIGHALGLAHSSDPNSVMYGVVSGSNQDLNAGDIAGMQAIYGTTPVKVAATTTTSPAATIDVSSLGQQQLADVTSSLLAPLSSAAMPLTVASAPAPLLYNIDATQTILLPLAA